MYILIIQIVYFVIVSLNILPSSWRDNHSINMTRNYALQNSRFVMVHAPTITKLQNKTKQSIVLATLDIQDCLKTCVKV